MLEPWSLCLARSTPGLNQPMRKSILVVVVLLGLATGARAVEVGTRVVDFRLNDTEGRTHALSGYAGKIVVLAFWAFKCPVALAANVHLAAIENKYGARGVVVLAIASSANETPVEIRRNAANLKLTFPVLLDADGIVAEKLGATHTPTVFVVDQTGMLRYQGGLENPRDGGRNGPVEESLDAMLGGRPVALPETPPSGCTIRRR
jgi:peroxiredoxin